MLILTRRVGETIVIGGGEITIRVLRVGHRVQLGIDAPEDTYVDRGEVFLQRELAGAGPSKAA